MTNNDTSLTQFYMNCKTLAERIRANSEELRDLLLDYETANTSEDEIERSIETLLGAKAEFAPIERPLYNLRISTFFPLNLPLYSLVLFGVMPSAFSSNVFIRPPEIMQAVLAALMDKLGIQELFPAVTLHNLPRHIFMELYTKESDAIIFTGKYENALSIHKQCPDALLLYNGSGVNPFLLFKNADVELAAQKAVEMRCFNSGQDCAGPDAFFVPELLADEFIHHLKNLLKDVKVGSSNDPEVRVSRTMKSAYIEEIKTWLKDKQDEVIFGGKIDAENQLVHPTIVRRALSDHPEAFHEFFAPIFYVLTYKDDAELMRTLSLDSFTQRAMYISIFGYNTTVEEQLNFVKLLRNSIVNDTERGNEEYGGYGPKANFLLYGDRLLVQPVLVSRDLHRILAS